MCLEIKSLRITQKTMDESKLQNSDDLPAQKIIRTQVKLTKIKFTKNEDCLEIVIPPADFWSAIWNRGFLAIVCNTIAILIAVNSFSDNLFWLLLWWSGSLYLLYQFIFDLFGHIQLRIDSQKINVSYTLFRFRLYSQRSALQSTHSITNLVYIEKHSREIAQGSIEEPATLEIWVGAEKYKISIPSNRVKNELEIEWLVRELSDWLGIEIEYPLSKNPN
jgi:hypothetical protein